VVLRHLLLRLCGGWSIGKYRIAVALKTRGPGKSHQFCFFQWALVNQPQKRGMCALVAHSNTSAGSSPLRCTGWYFRCLTSNASAVVNRHFVAVTFCRTRNALWRPNDQTRRIHYSQNHQPWMLFVSWWRARVW